MSGFPKRRLIQTLAVDEVEKTTPVNLNYLLWRNPENLKGKVIRISPQVKQRKVLSTDPTGDADSRIIEVLVKLDQDSVDIVQNYAGMKVIAKFIP